MAAGSSSDLNGEREEIMDAVKAKYTAVAESRNLGCGCGESGCGCDNEEISCYGGKDPK